MKFFIYTFIFSACLVYTSCSDSAFVDNIDEKEILDADFSYLQVYVYSLEDSSQGSSSSTGCSTGCSTETQEHLSDAEVSLYSSIENMTNDIGPEISLNTNSRGVARFDNLEGTSYYVYVKDSKGEKTLFIQTKKGELVRASVGL